MAMNFQCMYNLQLSLSTKEIWKVLINLIRTNETKNKIAANFPCVPPEEKKQK